MDKEKFKQLFAISYLACRFANLCLPTDDGKKPVDETIDRFAEASWLHFCQLWPEEYIDPQDNGR